jgi:hypothetical protein
MPMIYIKESFRQLIRLTTQFAWPLFNEISTLKTIKIKWETSQKCIFIKVIKSDKILINGGVENPNKFEF